MKRKPILFLVEDDPLYRPLLKTDLESLGWVVRAYAEQYSAIADLDEDPDYDIALIDRHLPSTAPKSLLQWYRQMGVCSGDCLVKYLKRKFPGRKLFTLSDAAHPFADGNMDKCLWEEIDQRLRTELEI
jgi:CheY-like chemotaxis protein